MSQVLRLDLTLTEPTAVTDGSAESAGHRTIDWIPGTMLLGATVPILGLSPSDDRFRRIFLSDEVRFIDAIPSADGRRTRPRPLSLAIPKDADGPAIDRAIESAAGIPHDRARPGHVLDDPRIECAPDRILRDHVGIEASTRTAANGILFAYEAMAAGTTLTGFVICEDASMAGLLKTAITERGYLRIGRSRQGGYGRVAVQVTDWNQPIEADSTPSSRPTRITLATDYCPAFGDAPLQALSSELAEHGVTVHDAWCETRIVRGFRGIWRLPRPAVEVLSRGSVLRVSCDRDLDPSIVQAGLGTRRNEGFGRISLDPAPMTGHPIDVQPPPRAADPHRGRLDDESTVRRVESVLHDRRARRLASSIASLACQSERADRLVEHFSTSDRIRSSQWSNLRSVFADHRVASDPRRVETWFEGVCSKSRGDAWEKSIVPNLVDDGGSGEIRMSELVRNLIDADGDAWLHATTVACRLAGKTEDLSCFDTPARRHRVASLFIDGLVHRIARARRAKETNS